MTLWVADLVARATLLLALAAMFAVLLRRAPAATRHLVWLAALAGVLVLPASALMLPRVDVPVPLGRPTPQGEAGRSGVAPASRPDVRDVMINGDRDGASVPAAARLDVVPSDAARAVEPWPEAFPAPVTASDVADAVAPAAGAWRPSLAQWIGGAWLLGALLLFGRLAGGALITRRLVRMAEPLDDEAASDALAEVRRELGIGRAIRLLVSDRLAVPVTWGWRAPVVLVPAAARHWSSARWRVVLLHEATHVRRHDWVSQWLAHAACVVYWFNPAVWLSARRMRLEGERACDEGVIGAGTRASEYAEHLLEIASGCRRADWAAPAAVGMARRGQLENRLVAILRPVKRSAAAAAPAMRMAYAASGLVGIAVLAMAVVQPVVNAQAAPDAVPIAPLADLLVVPAPAPRPSPPVPALRPERVRPFGPDAAPRPAPLPLPPHAAQAGQSSQAAQADQREPLRNLSEELRQQARELAEREREQSRYAAAQAREQIEPMREQLEAARHDLSFDLDLDFDQFQYADFDPLALAQVFVQGPDGSAGTIDPRIADAFMAALGDTEPDVREDAARALGRYRVETAVGPLTRALEDENADVREEAARALGRIRSPEAIQALMGALDDPEIDVREQAIAALGSLRSAEAVPGLVRALQDPEPDIAESAARALGAIRDPSAIDGLLAATRHADPDVVEAALRSLATFNDPRAIDALTAAVKHENPEVRRLAISVLSRSRYATTECRDGVDNDNDGLIDGADPDCR